MSGLWTQLLNLHSKHVANWATLVLNTYFLSGACWTISELHVLHLQIFYTFKIEKLQVEKTNMAMQIGEGPEARKKKGSLKLSEEEENIVGISVSINVAGF